MGKIETKGKKKKEISEIHTFQAFNDVKQLRSLVRIIFTTGNGDVDEGFRGTGFRPGSDRNETK